MKAFGTTMEITTYPPGEYRSSPDLAQWVSKAEWHRVAIKWNLRLGQTGAWVWRQGDEVERISDKPADP